MASSYWNKDTLTRRVADPQARRRHEAGSPNPQEIDLYCALASRGGTGLTLGMTPELRHLAESLCERTYAVDQNRDAIDFYLDWLDDNQRDRETVVQANWLDLKAVLQDIRVNLVLGDGIFGNILSLEGHSALLSAIHDALADGGRFVTRHALAPTPRQLRSLDELVTAYRVGQLSEDDFGFSLRILSHWHDAYDTGTFLLDCQRVYELLDEDLKTGAITPAERALAERFVFKGKNMLLPEDRWMALLGEAGFSVSKHKLEGHNWYAFYPLYRCVV